MALHYRLASYLTSILCTSIVTTALICSIVTPPRFNTSYPSTHTSSTSPPPLSSSPLTSRHSSADFFSETSSRGYIPWSSKSRGIEETRSFKWIEGSTHGDFDYGSDKASRSLYSRDMFFQIKDNIRSQRFRGSNHPVNKVNEMNFRGTRDDYVVKGGGNRNGYLLLLKPGHQSITVVEPRSRRHSLSRLSRNSNTVDSHRRRRHHHRRSHQHQQLGVKRLDAGHLNSVLHRSGDRTNGENTDFVRKATLASPIIIRSSGYLSALSPLSPSIPSPLASRYCAMKKVLRHLCLLASTHPGIHNLICGTGIKYTNALGQFNHLDTTKDTHSPRHIPPHPVLVMLASNLVVRLGFLAILCMGALYYFVMIMEQHITRGALSIASSNWWGDSITIGMESRQSEHAAAVNSPRTRVNSNGLAMGTGILERSESGANAGNDNVISDSEMINRPLNPTTTATTTTPERESEDARIVATTLTTGLISALIRSTPTAVAFELPNSASTTPLLSCSTQFQHQSVRNKKPGFEDDQQQQQQQQAQRSYLKQKKQDQENGNGYSTLFSVANNDQTFKGYSCQTPTDIHHQYEVVGESSRSSSRRPSIAPPESSPLSPSTRATRSIDDCADSLPLQSHFYNMSALQYALFDHNKQRIHRCSSYPGGFKNRTRRSVNYPTSSHSVANRRTPRRDRARLARLSMKQTNS